MNLSNRVCAEIPSYLQTVVRRLNGEHEAAAVLVVARPVLLQRKYSVHPGMKGMAAHRLSRSAGNVDQHREKERR